MNPNVIWRMAALLLLGSFPSSAQPTQLSLRPALPGVNGWFRLASDGYYDPISEITYLYAVDSSVDLLNWIEIATLHGANILYTDPASRPSRERFYRLRAIPPDVTDWKNQITTPADEFSSPVQFISWVKFAIATNEPTRVYFAASGIFDLHYHFVTNRVPGFANLSQAEVDLMSQCNTNRQLYLGTIIQPWNAVQPSGFVPAPEYGIQLVGRDPIPPEKVKELYDIVRSAVRSPPATLVTYLPTFEQSASAEANRAFFEANGILLRRADDWIRTETCYSLGWALGRLVFVSAANIPTAYANGTLLPTDILLTDGVPAELPYVAGIISFAAATPNSHVAILAQSYNVPFVFVSDPATRSRILGAVNGDVVLQLTAASGQLNPCQMLFTALDTDFDAALRASILALKRSPPLNIRRKERFGAYTSPTTDLRPEHARYFGGKAANFGLLRRVIPTNSPTPSLAISMDLYDDFMEQVMGSGLTLRTEISNRLSQYTYPANVAALKADLNIIRTMIRNQTQFTAGQQQAILTALTPFATNRNIRFRSSSNVEDSDYFSGAGLYESFSGCSGDDLDSNTSGPSICDPTENGERGVFRAIRRVYGSFFNDNAFLERLRLGIKETDVGMGMLVHYSAPDETEMANGVATVRNGLAGATRTAYLVSQLGAVSITNPDGNTIPEEVQADDFGLTGISINLLKPSNLVPFGQRVMTWPSDYEDLGRLLFLVANAYEASNSKPNVVLDFEYKKIQPGILDVKQVREVPSLVNTQRIDPYLLNERRVFTTQQSTDGGDVCAVHRLKSRWTFDTRNFQVNTSNLLGGFFTNFTVELISGDRVVTNTLTGLSGVTYQVEEQPGGSSTALYSWTMPSAVGPASYQLSARFDRPQVSPQLNPFAGLGDFSIVLRAGYDHPVWFLHAVSESYDFDFVRLTPVETNSPHEVLMTLDYDQGVAGPTNLTIASRYYLGSNAAYQGNPPLFRFEETRLEGLTSQPIVLRGFFSQSWNGNHRQSYEFFLFEPHLEEGIDPVILQELEAKNIRMIHVEKNMNGPTRVFTYSTHDAGPLP